VNTGLPVRSFQLLNLPLSFARPALPTAVSDGEHVVAYLTDYGLVALDVEGGDAWEWRLEHPGYGFGVGTSPLLYDGVLVLSRDGGPEAVVQAQGAQTDDGPERTLLRAKLAHAVGLLRTEQFPAVVGPQCRECPFEPICPAKSAGRGGPRRGVCAASGPCPHTALRGPERRTH